MVFLIPIALIVFWLAVLAFVVVVGGMIWKLCRIALLMDSVIRRKPKATVPELHVRPKAPLPPDTVIPRWSAAHRRYVDGDHLQWQREFAMAEFASNALPGRGPLLSAASGRRSSTWLSPAVCPCRAGGPLLSAAGRGRCSAPGRQNHAKAQRPRREGCPARQRSLRSGRFF
jgi:hypothetical protein